MTTPDKHQKRRDCILPCFAVTLAAILYMDRVCIGGLLAPWTIPYILDVAGGQWRVVILATAGWYAVGTFCWLGIDSVTPMAGSEKNEPRPR